MEQEKNAGIAAAGSATGNDGPDKGVYRKKRGKMRIAAVAICSCVLLIAATALGYVFLIGPKAGGSPGVLANGTFYFNTVLGFYSYTPEQKRFVLPYSGMLYMFTDDYGIFYTSRSGDTLYVRDHDAGKKRKLYQAKGGELSIETAHHGIVTFRDGDMETYTLLQMDGKTGEVLWQKPVKPDQWVPRDFYAGDIAYSVLFAAGERRLFRDGEPILPEGAHMQNEPYYLGDNLMMEYYYDVGYNRVWGYLLAKPDGALLDILPGKECLTGTSDFLLYIEENADPEAGDDVFCYDIEGGASWPVHSGMDVNWATTDGTLLYTSVPWRGGRTDCWSLQYDETGKLTGFELIAADI